MNSLRNTVANADGLLPPPRPSPTGEGAVRWFYALLFPYPVLEWYSKAHPMAFTAFHQTGFGFPATKEAQIYDARSAPTMRETAPKIWR